MRRVTFRATLDELWKRAEEIRALCGLPPIARTGIPHDSAEALIEVLLHDLEANFRRELVEEDFDQDRKSTRLNSSH